MDSIHDRSSEQGIIFTKWWRAVRVVPTRNKPKLSSDDVRDIRIGRVRSHPDIAKLKNVVVVRRRSKSLDLGRPSRGTYLP